MRYAGWSLGLCVSFLAPGAGVSQQPAPPPPPILTLQEALDLAREHNLALRNAALETAKSRDEVASSRTRLLPATRVDLIGSQLTSDVGFEFPQGAFGVFPGIGPVPAEDTVVESPRGFNTFVSAGVTQPLSQLYRAGLGVKMSRVGVEASEEKERELRQAVAGEVKRLYYAVIRTRSASAASASALELYRELHRVVEERVARQTALPVDALEVRARLASEESRDLMLRHALATGKEQLNDLMGRDLGTEFSLGEVAEPTPLETDLEASRAQALERRPEVRQARLGIRQAELALRLSRADLIPDLSVGYSYLSNFNIDVLPRDLSSVRLIVQWEPFTWGRRGREQAEKSKALEQAQNSARDAENKVLLDVNARFRALQETRLAIDAARLAREAAAERARLASDRYRQESALLKDVLQAQSDLAEASSRYDEAVLSFWTSRAELEKATGEE